MQEVKGQDLECYMVDVSWWMYHKPFRCGWLTIGALFSIHVLCMAHALPANVARLTVAPFMCESQCSRHLLWISVGHFLEPVP